MNDFRPICDPSDIAAIEEMAISIILTFANAANMDTRAPSSSVSFPYSPGRNKAVAGAFDMHVNGAPAQFVPIFRG